MLIAMVTIAVVCLCLFLYERYTNRQDKILQFNERTAAVNYLASVYAKGCYPMDTTILEFIFKDFKVMPINNSVLSVNGIELQMETRGIWITHINYRQLLEDVTKIYDEVSNLIVARGNENGEASI